MNKIVLLCILCLQQLMLVATAAQPIVDPALITDKSLVIPVVVIGGGPAGYAAGLYCARAGFETKVFEGPLPGGQLTQSGTPERASVENWPGVKRACGAAIMEQMRQQVVDGGANVVQDIVVSLDCSRWPFVLETESGKTVHALTVVLATGSTPKMLDVLGEKEYFGRGVSICAVCDAWAFDDKDVVVVGGGDSAVEEALQLASHARQVTVLVRRDCMRASLVMQEQAQRTPNVRVEYGKEIIGIYGDGEVVTAIDVRDRVTGNIQRRAIDGIFLAAGHTPCNGLVVGQVALDEHGCVIVQGRSQATVIPCLFAAGEIADPFYRQAATAAGDGHKAGRDVERRLYALGLTPQVTRSWKKA